MAWPVLMLVSQSNPVRNPKPWFHTSLSPNTSMIQAQYDTMVHESGFMTFYSFR